MKQITITGKLEKDFGLTAKNDFYETVNLHVSSLKWTDKQMGHITEDFKNVQKRIDLFCDHKTIGIFFEVATGRDESNTFEIHFPYSEEDSVWKLFENRKLNFHQFPKHLKALPYTRLWINKAAQHDE